MPTNQETFDLVVAHAREQGCKAETIEEFSPPNCMYRGPNGTKCFIGCLLPDSSYCSSLESVPCATEFNGEFSEVAVIMDDLGYDIPFLAQLQSIHDTDEVEYWEERFESLATEFTLEYEPPTAAVASENK